MTPDSRDRAFLNALVQVKITGDAARDFYLQELQTLLQEV